MSLTDKKQLIDIVELNPDLWKLTKKAPNLKQKLWNTVGAKLGISGFDARRTWEILRDQFRREYKRFTYDRTYKSKWIFYKRMLFVRHALRPRNGLMYHSNSDNDEHGSAEEQQSLDTDVSHTVDEEWSTQSGIENLPKIHVRQDLQGNTSTDSSHSQVTIHKSIEVEPSTSVGVSSSCQRPSYDEIDFSTTRVSRRWHVDRTEDEDYHFVMSILPSLRSIQHAKKLRVRSKIMELIATELDADFDAQNQLQLALHHEVRIDSDGDEKFLVDKV